MGTITPLARMEINWAYVGCLKFGPKLGKLTVYRIFFFQVGNFLYEFYRGLVALALTLNSDLGRWPCQGKMRARESSDARRPLCRQPPSDI